MSVLVPSRGRPSAMAELSDHFKESCRDSTVLHWILDADDPQLDEYHAAYRETTYQFQALWIVPKGTPGIVWPVNWVIDEIFRPEFGFYPTVLGFLGDDFVPRTEGWDLKLQGRLSQAGTGVAYGNDLFQRERLATAWFVTRDIVQTLGHLAPRELRHLWVDNYWMDLGRGADCLYYLEDVVLEHMHPLAGKAEWDPTYERNNKGKTPVLDKQAYTTFVRSGKLQRDIDIVKALKEDGRSS